ncbi:glycosyltransferase family 4 protein [Pseudomonas sp. RIT-PI-AD]|uniref:glycosyltransferase family 4 protein n=1 Tax=Pseudomonas sp. RIT-PI-AD TaxID=3035294 RepID=UPI0021D849C0|nr:glycosyltransferase family 4 protein [Pseudomonas sp. RIT-PI-AD]
MKRVAVLNTQVPFTRGGAEILCESLVEQINRLPGIQADLLTLPFKWYPDERLIADTRMWRDLDLSESDGQPIDLLIATKFPTYAVRHPNKVLWLVHQHRQAYDPAFDPEQRHTATNLGLRALDDLFFQECRGLFSISNRVSERLHRFNGFRAEALLPPSGFAGRIQSGDYSDTLIYFGRLNEWKRPDMLVRAVAAVPRAKARIIGTGPEPYVEELRRLIDALGVGDRVELLGFLDDAALLHELARCRAVFYAPYDEDYGFSTIEAFLAHKPVLTLADSGEVQSLVTLTGSGIVARDEAALAHGVERLYGMTAGELHAMADPGQAFARTIGWPRILQKLVLDNL